MSARIFKFQDYKKIEYVDVKYQGKDMVFDIIFKINQCLYILKDLHIEDILKDKIKYLYGSIHHYNNIESGIEFCPFCGNKFNDLEICKSLTEEKVDIFTNNLSSKIFFPLMSYYYNQNDDSYYDGLNSIHLENFKSLFFGVCEGKYIQCIFEYNKEILLFQDVLDPNDIEYLPLVFYYNKERENLHLYVEYLLPEKLIPIANTINKEINAQKKDIMDTTGISLLDLYNEIVFKNR
ncbi:hypothetical protein AAGG74_17365 [Bacillus mexicanus]|uniref:hypothetical protein n=1 Tax=Bacillus mexicanus TaxID=2834415 RepID=UPI003D1F86EC